MGYWIASTAVIYVINISMSTFLFSELFRITKFVSTIQTSVSITTILLLIFMYYLNSNKKSLKTIGVFHSTHGC